MACVAITLLNQKGGVGKTSTTYHLGGTLARDGKRVLVVDVDPQASLTQGFEGPNFMRALDRRSSVAAMRLRTSTWYMSNDRFRLRSGRNTKPAE